MIAAAALAAAAAAAPHPACQAMSTYQAPYVAEEYNRSKHLGHYYELAFRDLYLGAPKCDCQHTYKVGDGADDYHEDFEQKCIELGRMASVLAMNSTGAGVALYNQSFLPKISHPNPPIPGLANIVFNTATVAFKAVPHQQQYEWVIEFTCGEEPSGTLNVLFPGGFVGINMYSRSGPTHDGNLQEMLAAAKDLGLGWALDSWGWGFHTVPHNSSCEYNPPTVQEYACTDGECAPVRWGFGTNLTTCQATCS